MFCRSWLSLTDNSRFLRRSLLATLLLLISLTVIRAQGVGSTRGLSSTGGSNTIQGRVFFPVDPADGNKRIKVRLESVEAMVSQITFTDDDGSFRFNQLSSGPYTVVVEASKEFEAAREPVLLEESGRVVTVQVYLKMKDSAAAFPDIPKPAIDLYYKALESVKKGDNKKVTDQLNSAIGMAPKFTAALGELGLQYLKLGQPDKAAEPLKKAIELSPKDFMTRLNYGIALFGKKNYGEAEPQLREALKLKSAAPTAHMYLGITLLSLSRDEKTKQFNPAKWSEAQTELETAVRTGKDEVAQAHRYLGGIYWGNKDYKRAADEFEVYVKLEPKAADADKIRASIQDLRSKQ
ncbi:MAG: tetratricopeptide repeat protein [bacterium]